MKSYGKFVAKLVIIFVFVALVFVDFKSLVVSAQTGIIIDNHLIETNDTDDAIAIIPDRFEEDFTHKNEDCFILICYSCTGSIRMEHTDMRVINRVINTNITASHDYSFAETE